MKKHRSNCAGIDIGSAEVYVSADGLENVRVFKTYTNDFKILVKLFLEKGITSVAMEATGVYWVVLYEMLDASRIDVWLVDGRQTKQVPGRKTDVKDCQWIHQLHTYGLLNRCHIVVGDIKTLRSYVRLREDHIQSASRHINHMHKALTQMNIRLKEVISQLHGKSGMAMIEAILSGERNKQVLLDLCHGTIIKKKKEQILEALEGHYKEDQLFALQQAVDAYKFYQEQIQQCDQKIDIIIQRIGLREIEPPKGKQINRKQTKDVRKAIRHNKPQIKKFGEKIIQAYSGIDVSILPGINDYSAMKLMSELGYDLSKWKSEKHFTSWLGLAPGQNNSGKKNRQKSRKVVQRAGQVFRQIANNLMNKSQKTYLAHFGRRLKSRKGPYIATKAVARKLAIFYYRLMTKGTIYVEQGIENYKIQLRQQKLRSLNKIAKELNIEVMI